MNSDKLSGLIGEAQAALRAFLSTLLGGESALVLDAPVPSTAKETLSQSAAYFSLVCEEMGFAVMLDDDWVRLLSKAMLSEEIGLDDPGAEDLVRELADQAFGTIRTALAGHDVALNDASFKFVAPGTELSPGPFTPEVFEVSFGLKVDDKSYGGFALLPRAAAPAPGKSAAPAERRPAAPSIDVAPISFPDLGVERIQGDGGGYDLNLLSDVELEVTVELGRRRLPLADLLRLTTGSVLELEKLVGEPLEVYANGRLIAEGEAVVIDEQFGIRVTSLASTRQRSKRVL